ncbi:DNA polymerase [Rhizobium sp. 18065]|uniref:DNA polymerase n=1 Tax=Rhizobium sp. 18065 TaxID=2681411 RepID=UPI00135AB75D|nr:DNA polymerase [Rhizobium sp. 18065]
MEAPRERLIFDIETNGFLDKLDRIHCIAIGDIRSSKIDLYGPERIDEAIARLEAAEYVAGHNIIEYDIPAIKKIYPSFKLSGRITDTLIVGKIIWPHLKALDFDRVREDHTFPKNMIGRHGLEAWGHRFKLHKGDYSKKMKELGLDPWEAYNDEMGSYCVQDVAVNMRLWREQFKRSPSPKAVRTEHAIFEIIRRQERRGIRFNVRKAHLLYAQLTARRQELTDQLTHMIPPWWAAEPEARFERTRRVGLPQFGKEWVTAIGKRGQQLKAKEVFRVYKTETEGDTYQKVELIHFNPASRDQVADRLIKLFGWKPLEFTDSGKPKVDDETLKALEDIPACKLLAEWYMIEKRLGQLSEGKNGWLRKITEDERIHGRMDTIGTQTSRATHFEPNLGQVPSITNADGPVPFGKECRELFTVDPGYVLLGVDCSGLELRCLGHYMAPFDGGAYADIVVNGDIHWENAQALGLVPRGTKRDKHNKVHEDARAVAKRFIYAFLYGAGPELIGALAGVDDEEVYALGGNKTIATQLVKKGRHPDRRLIATISKGKKLIDTFTKSLPALKALKEWIKAEMAKNDKSVPGLDGRLIPSRSEHSALNFLLQSAGAIICKQWIVQFHEDLIAAGYVEGVDFAQLLWVHDEVQVQVRPEIAEDIKRRILAAIPKVGDYYDFRVPLTGDGQIGMSWAETH